MSLSPTSDATFAADVLAAPGVILVDVWAAWCGPCKQLTPVLEQLADELSGQLTVRSLDADANPATVAALRVGTLPTLVLFRDGQEVARSSGAKPKAMLLGWLRPHLG